MFPVDDDGTVATGATDDDAGAVHEPDEYGLGSDPGGWRRTSAGIRPGGEADTTAAARTVEGAAGNGTSSEDCTAEPANPPLPGTTPESRPGRAASAAPAAATAVNCPCPCPFLLLILKEPLGGVPLPLSD